MEEKDLTLKVTPALKMIGNMKKQLLNLQKFMEETNKLEHEKIDVIVDLFRRG